MSRRRKAPSRNPAGNLHVTGLGNTYAADRARPDLLPDDHPGGEHIWIATAAWRVSSDAAAGMMRGEREILMDAENLALAAIGCYACEEPWTEQVARLPCPGDSHHRPAFL